MSKRQKPMTAAQFIEWSKTDPGYQKTAEENRKRNLEAQQIALSEDAIVVAELRRIGENANSVWDFVNTTRSYPKAIPVTASHLNRGYSGKYLEALLRALIVPEAKGVVWIELMQLLSSRKREFIETSPYPLGTIFHALGLLATESNLPDVLTIIGDKSFGKIRVVIVNHLKVKKPNSSFIGLAEAFDPDPDIRNEYERFLRRLRRSVILETQSVTERPPKGLFEKTKNLFSQS